MRSEKVPRRRLGRVGGVHVSREPPTPLPVRVNSRTPSGLAGFLGHGPRYLKYLVGTCRVVKKDFVTLDRQFTAEPGQKRQS